jgi:hypothetical protein
MQRLSQSPAHVNKNWAHSKNANSLARLHSNDRRFRGIHFNSFDDHSWPPPAMIERITERGGAVGGGIIFSVHPLARAHRCTNCACSINWRRRCAGIAPDCRVSSAPFPNTINVGIPAIENCCAIAGRSSVLTFATIQRPAPSRATFSSSGATILHGPHHGAQKSTSTGTAALPVNAANSLIESTVTGSAGPRSSV